MSTYQEAQLTDSAHRFYRPEFCYSKNSSLHSTITTTKYTLYIYVHIKFQPTYPYFFHHETMNQPVFLFWPRQTTYSHHHTFPSRNN